MPSLNPTSEAGQALAQALPLAPRLTGARAGERVFDPSNGIANRSPHREEILRQCRRIEFCKGFK